MNAAGVQNLPTQYYRLKYKIKPHFR